jgi:hypothetical protein
MKKPGNGRTVADQVLQLPVRQKDTNTWHCSIAHRQRQRLFGNLIISSKGRHRAICN